MYLLLCVCQFCSVGSLSAHHSYPLCPRPPLPSSPVTTVVTGSPRSVSSFAFPRSAPLPAQPHSSPSSSALPPLTACCSPSLSLFCLLVILLIRCHLRVKSSGTYPSRCLRSVSLCVRTEEMHSFIQQKYNPPQIQLVGWRHPL